MRDGIVSYSHLNTSDDDDIDYIPQLKNVPQLLGPAHKNSRNEILTCK